MKLKFRLNLQQFGNTQGVLGFGTPTSYTYNGVTADGIPRHPRYKGIRYD